MSEASTTSALLSDTTSAAIDRWLAKYPADRRQSAIIPALLLAQEQQGGWLSEELVKAVADYIGIPHIVAFEVATFYSMYELQPTGRHKICVCTNISCLLRGSDAIVARLKERLGIDWGETTPDGKFTLKEVECLGACANAPMFQIGHRYYEDLTPAKVDTILQELE